MPEHKFPNPGTLVTYLKPGVNTFYRSEHPSSEIDQLLHTKYIMINMVATSEQALVLVFIGGKVLETERLFVCTFLHPEHGHLFDIFPDKYSVAQFFKPTEEAD